MIRKLVENDRNIVLEYLSEEPSINLFIIGDIENFGFDTEFQELWAEFDIDNNIKAVMLRYHESFVPYSHNEDFDIIGFIEIYNSFQTDRSKILSGVDRIINLFKNRIDYNDIQETFFCELKNDKNLIKDFSLDIKKANVSDAKRVFDLIAQIEEFHSVPLERTIKKIETNTGRIYYIEENDSMVSVSQTTAENRYSAMIVGVATLPGYRKKGYMSMCLSKLCIDCLEDEKTLCLFYDNPKAGSVYHKLGFKTIGKWIMLTKKSDGVDE